MADNQQANNQTLQKLQKILFILEGAHPDDGGLIRNFKKMEERVNKLEKFNTKLIYIFLGLSFGLGLSVSKLLELLHK